LTIRELLEEMIERSHVLLPRPDSLLENATLPSSVVTKNSGKFKCTMKLVQSVLTKEQKQMLALPKKSRQEIKDFPKIMKAQLYNIEKNAAEKMKELDQQSRSTTTTMLGLGNRYEQYLKKNKINEAPEANQQILSKYFSKS
jgi:ribosome-binding ATPase YchF (GTP1/OBG family)